MHLEFASHLLWIGGALLLSILFGALARKLGQPRVLGALLGGLFLGTALTGTDLVHELRSSHGIPFIAGLAEFGAMLLLFKAGLEGNLYSILRDARTGWKVAVTGVIVPMFGGFVYAMEVAEVPWTVALFQGGVFAATSVGITAAVLQELGVMSKPFARTIISAAVIDDVLGLIVLTLCGALNAPGSADTASIAWSIGGAALFVLVVPVIGHFLAPRLLRALNQLDVHAREAIVLAFLLLYGAGAMYAGLAAIVGAYFAGVALDELYFEGLDKDPGKPVEHFVDGLITAFGPIFFVYAGCIVDPTVFLKPDVLLNGLAFTAIAVGGKLACGLMVPEDRMIVGVGMAPRGEVGIVFATIGLQTGILSDKLFGASMIMVLLTTMVTPIALNVLVRRPSPAPPLADAPRTS